MEHRYTFVFLAMLSFPLSGYSQDASRYAQMAKATFSSFECSYLASLVGERYEKTRLFQHGYDKGTVLLSALESGETTIEQMKKKRSKAVFFDIQGPSADFILGRVFKSARLNALQNISVKGKRIILAFERFERLNCGLIGDKN